MSYGKTGPEPQANQMRLLWCRSLSLWPLSESNQLWSLHHPQHFLIHSSFPTVSFQLHLHVLLWRIRMFSGTVASCPPIRSLMSTWQKVGILWGLVIPVLCWVALPIHLGFHLVTMKTWCPAQKSCSHSSGTKILWNIREHHYYYMAWMNLFIWSGLSESLWISPGQGTLEDIIVLLARLATEQVETDHLLS